MIDHPTPKQIHTAREAASLTQQQAAELVHVDGRAWRRWEAGDRDINLAAWEIFLLRTAQHPSDSLAGLAGPKKQKSRAAG